jgi:hypothetical protein
MVCIERDYTYHTTHKCAYMCVHMMCIHIAYICVNIQSKETY